MMRRTCVVLFTLFLVGSPAWAATYYFSDCATGGSGTIADPYCLDPGADGNKESFDYLMDGVVPELAAGDTVYLCAGACDGSGMGTYNLSAHSCRNDLPGDTTCVFDPVVDGAVGQPVTIRPYCTGASCETVVLSGDTNANYLYDIGEPINLVNNVSATFFPTTSCQSTNIWGQCGLDYYTWFGDPNTDGVPNLIMERIKQSFFWLNRGGSGWIVDGLELRYLDAPMYPVTTPGADGISDISFDCTHGTHGGNFSVFKTSMITGTLTLRNNLIHHNCGNAFRVINNCGLNPVTCDTVAQDTMLVEGNTVYNNYAFWSSHGGRRWIIRNNTAYDNTGSMSLEENVTDVTVEDNNISCRGFYNVAAVNDAKTLTPNPYQCRSLILVNDGDAPPTDGCGDPGSAASKVCTTRDIRIRRNVIWGNAYNGELGARGNAISGISWQAHNSAGSLGASVIENNIIKNIQIKNGCEVRESQGSNGYVGRLNANPLTAWTASEGLTIQNNTVYDSGCYGLLVGGGGRHTVRNNLVVQSRRKSGNQDTVEFARVSDGLCTAGKTANIVGRPNACYRNSDCDTSVGAGDGVCARNRSIITNNNWYFGNGADPVVAEYDTIINSPQITIACVTVSTAYPSNLCSPTTFMSVAGTDETLWDLHLSSSDIANLDTGTTGALDDIDRESRPQGLASDIGADEASTGNPTPTNTPPSVTVGPDQTATLPNATVPLEAVVSDDGLPDPPGQVSTTWIIVSGPAPIDIAADPQSLPTTASFTMPGSYVLALEADDGAETVTALLTVTVHSPPDTQPPQLIMQSPTDNALVNTPRLEIRGTAIDDGSGVTAAFLNGQLLSLDADGAFAADAVLAEGQNVLTITATDRAGNTASVTVRVTLDTIPPSITIQAPTDGSLTHQRAVDVQYTADGGLPILEQHALPLEGPNVLAINAQDAAGNTSSAHVMVVRDTVAPTVSLQAFLADVAVRNIVLVQAQAGDLNGIAEVRFLADGQPIGQATSAPYEVAWDTRSVSNGAHRLSAVATDRAGNSAESAPQQVVVYNPLAPIVVIIAPQDGAVLDGFTWLKVSVRDDRRVRAVELYLGERLVSVQRVNRATRNLRFGLRVRKLLTPGQSARLEVRAIDDEGQVGRASITVQRAR